MFSLIFYLTILCTIAAYFSAYGWWFDLISHFRMQYFLLQCFFAVFFLMNRNWAFLLITLLFGSLNLIVIKPFYTDNPNKKLQYRLEQAEFKILQINLNIQSADDTKVVKLIYDVAPEILVLTEVKEERLRALSQVLNHYQTKKYEVRKDNFGIGLFTSLPVQHSEIKYFGGAEIPTVVASLRVNNEPLTIVATHTPPPVTKENFEWRNQHLKELALDRPNWGTNAVVVGDLNTSSWSRVFTDFLKTTQLRDSRYGFGIQPTWPAHIPFILIPIDHVLVDQNIGVLSRKIGPAIGSDHFPVRVHLRIYK